MRWLLVLAACAAQAQEVSPRQVTAETTACELSGVTVKNYEETDGAARWVATCYGRQFACVHSKGQTHCTVEEKRGREISAEALANRYNTCLAGKQAACHQLAEDFELGKNGVAPNRYTAIELYGYACKFGHQRDCVRGKMLDRAGASSKAIP